MSGVNKVILLGYVGREPDTRYSKDGMCVVNFSLATTEKWKDNEKTEWHKIVVFRQLAELCSKYITKGMRIYVEGKLQSRNYEQDGLMKYITEVIANSVVFLGNTSDSGTDSGSNSVITKSKTKPKTKPKASNTKSAGYADDDIPF